MVPAKTAKGALIAATNRGHNTVQLQLMNGAQLLFNVVEVMEDAILGNEVGKQHAAIVPYHAIAYMEFS